MLQLFSFFDRPQPYRFRRNPLWQLTESISETGEVKKEFTKPNFRLTQFLPISHWLGFRDLI